MSSKGFDRTRFYFSAFCRRPIGKRRLTKCRLDCDNFLWDGHRYFCSKGQMCRIKSKKPAKRLNGHLTKVEKEGML